MLNKWLIKFKRSHNGLQQYSAKLEAEAAGAACSTISQLCLKTKQKQPIKFPRVSKTLEFHSVTFHPRVRTGASPAPFLKHFSLSLTCSHPCILSDGTTSFSTDSAHLSSVTLEGQLWLPVLFPCQGRRHFVSLITSCCNFSCRYVFPPLLQDSLLRSLITVYNFPFSWHKAHAADQVWPLANPQAARTYF